MRHVSLPRHVSQTAEILKRELGLEGNMKDVIKQAAEQMGLATDQPLIKLAQLCLQTHRGTAQIAESSATHQPSQETKQGDSAADQMRLMETISLGIGFPEAQTLDQAADEAATILNVELPPAIDVTMRDVKHLRLLKPPEDASNQSIGMQFKESTGMAVYVVDEGSIAQVAGVLPGDVLLEINGNLVPPSNSAALDLLKAGYIATPAGGSLELTVKRPAASSVEAPNDPAANAPRAVVKIDGRCGHAVDQVSKPQPHTKGACR